VLIISFIQIDFKRRHRYFLDRVRFGRHLFFSFLREAKSNRRKQKRDRFSPLM